MVKYVKKPAIIPSVGNMPKLIEEFFGYVNTQSGDLSIARITSPAGWIEPAQTPEFDEYTLVLKGVVHVRTETDSYDVSAGEAFMTHRGKWVQYSTPEPEGAEYIAVCLPAFSPETVHREAE